MSRWACKQASKRASIWKGEHVSKQESKQASKHMGIWASKQASKRASVWTGEYVSKQASKHVSKHVGRVRWLASWSAHAWIITPIYILAHIAPKIHSAIMAHRVHVFSRELNALNKNKHDELKCNRIMDGGGMELVHCICDCVYNILQGNIPINQEEKERLKPHRHCLRKLTKQKTSDREKKRIIQRGGFLASIIPTLVGLVGKLFTGQ